METGCRRELRLDAWVEWEVVSSLGCLLRIVVHRSRVGLNGWPVAVAAVGAAAAAAAAAVVVVVAASLLPLYVVLGLFEATTTVAAVTGDW